MKKFVICIIIVCMITGVISAMALGDAENDFISEVEKSTKIEKAEAISKDLADVSTLNEQKQVLFNNLLNCVDYYDIVKGSFETTLIDKSVVTVTYEVDIAKQTSYEKVIGNNFDLETFCQNGIIIEADTRTKKYCQQRFIPQYDENIRKKQTKKIYEEVILQPYYDYKQNDISSQRVKTNEFGENEFYYRYDLTNTSYASNSIYSQNLVFGFLSDLDSWNIVAVEEYLDRQVLHITGETSDKDYAKKLQTDLFEMKIDVKTGVLLDFKGFASNGTLKQYLFTTDFSADYINKYFVKTVDEKIGYIKENYDLDSES